MIESVRDAYNAEARTVLVFGSILKVKLSLVTADFQLLIWLIQALNRRAGLIDDIRLSLMVRFMTISLYAMLNYKSSRRLFDDTHCKR